MTEPVKTQDAPVSTKSTSVPVNIWDAMRTEMNGLIDRFGSGWLFPVHGGSMPSLSFKFRTPVVDLTEDDKEFKLTAELAGLTDKDVEVAVSGDLLTIKGEKKEETERTEKNHHISERSYGAFHRAFYIPTTVDLSKIAGSFHGGVLTVTMPKSAEANTKDHKIEIKAA